MFRKVLASLLLIVAVLPSGASFAQDNPFITPVACAEPGNLSMWVWDDTWLPIIAASIEVWQEKYCPGAQVDLIQQPWNQYWDAVRANADSSELPDVFNMTQVYFNAYTDVLLDL